MAEEIKGLETEKLTPQQQEQLAIQTVNNECSKEINNILDKFNRKLIVYGDIRNPQVGVAIK